MRTLHIEEKACCELQQRIQQLEGQISATQLCLDKEKAKYHSACRQQEVRVNQMLDNVMFLAAYQDHFHFFLLVVVLWV